MQNATTSNGPWFDLPEAAYAAHARSAAISPDIAAAAQEYRSKGYLVRDFGFPDADLDEAAAYTRSIAGNRVQDAWLVNGAIRRLATSERVLAFLSELYQRQAFPFQTLNFPRGSEQDTHSDAYHFCSAPEGFMCGVWIALEDIHPDSGPLHYYPGSHRLPLVTNADLPGEDSGLYASHVAGIAKASGLPREISVIRKGQAFIWASNLFHGGTPIANPARTRLSQVNHYFFRGCSYHTPFASRGGRVFWREPYDIAAGRFVANAEANQRGRLTLRIGQRLRIWTRRPYAL